MKDNRQAVKQALNRVFVGWMLQIYFAGAFFMWFALLAPLIEAFGEFGKQFAWFGLPFWLTICAAFYVWFALAFASDEFRAQLSNFEFYQLSHQDYKVVARLVMAATFLFVAILKIVLPALDRDAVLFLILIGVYAVHPHYARLLAAHDFVVDTLAIFKIAFRAWLFYAVLVLALQAICLSIELQILLGLAANSRGGAALNQSERLIVSAIAVFFVTGAFAAIRLLPVLLYRQPLKPILNENMFGVAPRFGFWQSRRSRGKKQRRSKRHF